MNFKGWVSFRMVRILAFVAVFCLGSVSLGQAQDLDLTAGEEGAARGSLIGLGVGYAPDYEGSEDYEPVPLLRAAYTMKNGMSFTFFGNTLRFNLVPDGAWNAGLIARYRPERDDVDNDRVDRMKKVDDALELGGFAAYRIDSWMFSLALLGDVADAHDGYLVELGTSYIYSLSADSNMTLFVSANYADDDYMDTYFGVSAADSVRSGLQTFNADSGFKDVGLGLLYETEFSRHWNLLAGFKYSRLLGDAADSPLVDDEGSENQLLVGAVVGYLF